MLIRNFVIAICVTMSISWICVARAAQDNPSLKYQVAARLADGSVVIKNPQMLVRLPDQYDPLGAGFGGAASFCNLLNMNWVDVGFGRTWFSHETANITNNVFELTDDRVLYNKIPPVKFELEQSRLYVNKVICRAASGKFGAKSDRDKAIKWIQNKLNGKSAMDFLGQTPDGKQCGFYLTSIHGGLYYYVVVGLHNAKNPNNYIGIPTTPNAKIRASNAMMNFHSDESWGNDSKSNTVTIELNADGTAVRTIGVSDLKTIRCDLSSKK